MCKVLTQYNQAVCSINHLSTALPEYVKEFNISIKFNFPKNYKLQLLLEKSNLFKRVELQIRSDQKTIHEYTLNAMFSGNKAKLLRKIVLEYSKRFGSLRKAEKELKLIENFLHQVQMHRFSMQITVNEIKFPITIIKEQEDEEII